MTVSTDYEPEILKTDGGVTRFYFSWTIEKTSDLEVWYLDSSGNLTKLAETTDYTVGYSGSLPTSGYIDLPAAKPDGGYIAIYRKVSTDQTQTVDRGNTIPPDGIETALDHLARQIQDVRMRVERMLEFPQADPLTNISLVLPSPKASRGIKWDATGQKLVLTDKDPDVDPNTTAKEGYVSITSSDTTNGPLNTKVVATGGLAARVLSPGSDEKLELSIAPGVKSINSNYTLVESDRNSIIQVNGGASIVTITLPSSPQTGDTWEIFNSGTQRAVLVSASASIIGPKYIHVQSVGRFWYDGTNWIRLDNLGAFMEMAWHQTGTMSSGSYQTGTIEDAALDPLGIISNGETAVTIPSGAAAEFFARGEFADITGTKRRIKVTTGGKLLNNNLNHGYVYGGAISEMSDVAQNVLTCTVGITYFQSSYNVSAAIWADTQNPYTGHIWVVSRVWL